MPRETRWDEYNDDGKDSLAHKTMSWEMSVENWLHYSAIAAKSGKEIASNPRAPGAGLRTQPSFSKTMTPRFEQLE